MKKNSFYLICTLLCTATAAYPLTTSQPVDFNENSIGQYQSSDFKNDWLTGMYSSQRENLYISNLTSLKKKQKKTNLADDTHHNVFQVIYPAGDVGGSAGVAIPVPLSKDLSAISYDHLFFQYEVMFPSDFTPPEEGGGKLPGLTSDKNESGCVHNTPGFSSRYMWRDTDMEMYLYLYHPEKKEDCGDYIALNTPYYFPKGEWVTLTQEVQLNTNGHSDGYIRVWVNGILKLEKTGLKLIADDQDLHIDYAQLDAFPGGSDPDKWAFTSDQTTYFDNFIVSETKPILTNSRAILQYKKKRAALGRHQDSRTQ